MERNIFLTLKSINSIDEESTTTELNSVGVLRILENDDIEISYEESEATGFKGSTTFIIISKDSMVTMKRTGSAPSILTIEENQRHLCHYGTPYGDIYMGIYTHTVENNITFDGGDLYLKYTIDANSNYVSDNEIFLHVK
ncbi:MAG: DUF1934 domain-containing protein [Oscillospiraceae bacterium]|nr:DUF1934 domain-containing protein [Oscillospiraceae bacterium]